MEKDLFSLLDNENNKISLDNKEKIFLIYSILK